MKLSLRKSDSTAGNVLVLTVVVTGLVGFTLASYLSLVKVQNYNSMRSQAWNQVMPVIEAGLEDAVTHLNTHGTNDTLAIDGWSPSGNLFWIQRFLPDSYYVVTISNWSGPMSSSPVITSRAYVRMPVQVVNNANAISMQARIGSTTPAGYLARGVVVTTRRDALFAKGMVAKGQIDLNGNNIDSDSFDSTNSDFSTGGAYDIFKRKYNGDIATNSGLTNSLKVGNANIRGHVSTGPGGSVSVGNNGVVGGKAWHDGGNAGIQPGWSTDDMNVDFPDVDRPFTGGAWTPGAGVVNGVTYNYVLGDGNYQMSKLYMTGSADMIVKGNATLYITGNMNIAGEASIRIAPGGSLSIFVAGSNTSIGGNGIVNETGYAKNFFYYGMPGNTSLEFAGNANWVGVVYAPNAHFDLHGSGSGGMDFVGASITKTVTMNGHFKFHYDESLANLGPNRGYVVTTWNEMDPNDVNGLPKDIAYSVSEPQTFDIIGEIEY